MGKSKPSSFFRKIIWPFTVNSTADEELDLGELTAKERRHFSIDDLVLATNKFHVSHKLGEGGFGPVFRGKLDGKEIAVKKLSHRSSQGKREFRNEAKSLACLQHRNVVNLLGYCTSNTERLLVYEYMQNESLDKLLFNSNRRDLLDWKRRYDVILGVTKGLVYLHEEAPGCIIHRDIKPSNILLDEKWVPKIADFGMARFFPEDQTHATTRIVGTNGYMAPEYFRLGFLSQKADVFSFGVVILELISGQKNSSFNRDPNSCNLLEWAYKLYKKQRSWEIIDPLLTSSSIDAERDQIEHCLHVGLLCVQSDPDLRPKMSHVLEMLLRKPKIVEEAARPGYFGLSHIRRNGKATGSTVSGSSDRSNFSRSTESRDRTGTLSAASSSAARARRDDKGKRPVEY